jgi:HEAT repeat protein
MEEEYYEDEFEEQIDFNEVIDALLDASLSFPAKYLSRMSGLEGVELEQLKETWPQVAPLRRQRLLEDMESLTDGSFLVEFDEVFKLGLDDENSQVKQTAIRGLWENEEPAVGLKLIHILQNDPNPEVCAQAASGFGKYIYLGELEEIDQTLSNRMTQHLIDILSSNEPESVRRRALESLGFSSNPKVTELIESAHNKQREDWTISALIAMGRSANTQWIPQIIENLSHEEAQVRIEAARSAGLLGAQESVPHLLQRIDDPEEDVRLAAIWALSEVGGLDARAALEGLLKKSQDENEIDFLEEALENLDFNELNIDFEMFDIEGEDPDELNDEDDWDEED